MMKTISIMIPTYNEEENVELLYEAIKEEFKKNLKNYKYEILFIDNKSKDNTRLKLRKICEKDKGVKAIFNAHNFGQFNSPYYGILQTTGDCTVTMCADFQDPVEMIHKFVKEWENGYKIVIGIKSKSKEEIEKRRQSNIGKKRTSEQNKRNSEVVSKLWQDSNYKKHTTFILINLNFHSFAYYNLLC